VDDLGGARVREQRQARGRERVVRSEEGRELCERGRELRCRRAGEAGERCLLSAGRIHGEAHVWWPVVDSAHDRREAALLEQLAVLLSAQCMGTSLHAQTSWTRRASGSAPAAS
jgi:hypothetical protein